MGCRYIQGRPNFAVTRQLNYFLRSNFKLDQLLMPQLHPLDHCLYLQASCNSGWSVFVIVSIVEATCLLYQSLQLHIPRYANFCGIIQLDPFVVAKIGYMFTWLLINAICASVVATVHLDLTIDCSKPARQFCCQLPAKPIVAATYTTAWPIVAATGQLLPTVAATSQLDQLMQICTLQHDQQFLQLHPS